MSSLFPDIITWLGICFELATLRYKIADRTEPKFVCIFGQKDWLLDHENVLSKVMDTKDDKEMGVGE